MQAYIRALEEVLQRIIERLDEHEKELREAKRQATPFRREKRNKDRKKPGRKGGHSTQRRAEPEHIDEELSAPHPCTCPNCHGKRVREEGTYEQIQEDLEVRPVARRITIHFGVCQDCGARVEGRHPYQTSTARGAAAHQVGPTALSLATQLHYQQGVPFEKMAAILKELGLLVSKATLVRAMHRIAGRAEEPFRELLEQVLAEDVLHIDETGWVLDGEPCYLWVLSGKNTTVYFVRKTRSGDEIADFLEDFAGVFVTDGHAGYDKLGEKLLRALCHLHLLRNMKKLEAKTRGRAKALARDLIWWFQSAIALVSQRDELRPATFEELATDLENQYYEILDISPTDPANMRMVKRLLRWDEAVLRCLRDPQVPATNNHGERQIRPAVVLRKRGGCNRSPRGARTFERLSSIAATRSQHGLPFMDWVNRLLRSPVSVPLLC